MGGENVFGGFAKGFVGTLVDANGLVGAASGWVYVVDGCVLGAQVYAECVLGGNVGSGIWGWAVRAGAGIDRPVDACGAKAKGEVPNGGGVGMEWAWSRAEEVCAGSGCGENGSNTVTFV